MSAFLLFSLFTGAVQALVPPTNGYQNPVAAQYPRADTALLNATFWLFPVPKAIAASMTDGFPLLPPVGLPDDFFDPETQHPVLFGHQTQLGVRSNDIDAGNFSVSFAGVPWVDRVGNGTAFTFSHVNIASTFLTYIVSRVESDFPS